MTNEEINRYIHVEIMGKCWHDWRSMGPNWGFRCGNDCGATSSFSRNPDYCSDDSPRRLLNEVVAKVVTGTDGKFFLGDHINQLRPKLTIAEFKRYHDDYLIVSMPSILEMTAKQIATACVEAHKESK